MYSPLAACSDEGWLYSQAISDYTCNFKIDQYQIELLCFLKVRDASLFKGESPFLIEENCHVPHRDCFPIKEDKKKHM